MNITRTYVSGGQMSTYLKKYGLLAIIFLILSYTKKLTLSLRKMSTFLVYTLESILIFAFSLYRALGSLPLLENLPKFGVVSSLMVPFSA